MNKPFVIQRELEIEAPAAVAWQVLTDLSRYGEWNPFVPECRSSLRPGEPIEMRVKLGKRMSRQVERMISFDGDGRALSYCMRPLPLRALSSRRTQRIDPVDETRCAYHTRFELHGWLAPLVQRLLSRDLDVGFSGMTQGLKRRSEQVWASAAPN